MAKTQTSLISLGFAKRPRDSPTEDTDVQCSETDTPPRPSSDVEVQTEGNSLGSVVLYSF